MCPTPVVPHFERELVATGWSVRSGKIWTTDAHYRETSVQIDKWASRRDGQQRDRSSGRAARYGLKWMMDFGFLKGSPERPDHT
jgi:hypothetical protein